MSPVQQQLTTYKTQFIRILLCSGNFFLMTTFFILFSCFLRGKLRILMHISCHILAILFPFGYWLRYEVRLLTHSVPKKYRLKE